MISVIILALLLMSLTGMFPSPAILAHQTPAPVEEIVYEQIEEPDEQYEVDLLARLIHAEARGESLTGQVAVGAVVMNRVADRRFPDTIGEVIYQPRQFCPVSRGTLPRVPGESSREAARRALEGEDPTGGATYFYHSQLVEDQWIQARPVTREIGVHRFAQ